MVFASKESALVSDGFQQGIEGGRSNMVPLSGDQGNTEIHHTRGCFCQEGVSKNPLLGSPT